MIPERWAKNTVPGLVIRTVVSHGDALALIAGDSTLTYNELWRRSVRIAEGLRRLGIRRGDHVAMWLPNNVFFIPSFLAITSLGCVAVPMNTRYRSGEAEYILRNSDSHILITAHRFLGMDYAGMLGEVSNELKALKSIVIAGSDEDLPHIPGKRVVAMEELMRTASEGYGEGTGEGYEEGIAAAAGKVEADDVAVILYTSGTTGAPKGAMLTHANLCINARTTGEVMDVGPDDRYFLPLPLFHIFGLVLGCLTPLAFGAGMVLQEVFDARGALGMMEKHRCTMNFGVPAMFIMELETLRGSEIDLSSLRSGIMGGAPCPIEIVKAAMDEMGCNVCIGYGITETSPLVTLTRFDDTPETRANTVGKPLPGVAVRIVDGTGKEVSRGEMGEIAIRGNNMAGYYGMPERTAEVLDAGGWYYSGDLGSMDADGYVRVTGRKKDMIITGGFNVYPREIEELLFTHPSVQNAAVVGIPDARLGEVVQAYIILREGCTEDAEEIKKFLRPMLANFKVPKHVEFVDAFPMTQSGKVRKYRLREMAAEKV